MHNERPDTFSLIHGETRDIEDGFCDVGAYEFKPNETSFFVIPIPGKKAVIIPL